MVRYNPAEKIDLIIAPDFVWKDQFHGASQRWWIFIEELYIAPLNGIIRERMNEWQKGLVPSLDKQMVEMTGFYTRYEG